MTCPKRVTAPSHPRIANCLRDLEHGLVIDLDLRVTGQPEESRDSNTQFV